MSSLMKKLKGKKGQSSTANKRYDLTVTLGCTGTGKHSSCAQLRSGFGKQTAHIYNDILQQYCQGWGKPIAEHPDNTTGRPLPVELKTDLCSLTKGANEARGFINNFIDGKAPVEVAPKMWSKELSYLMIILNGIEKVTATLDTDAEDYRDAVAARAQGVDPTYRPGM